MRSGVVFTFLDVLTGKTDIIYFIVALFSILAILFVCQPFHECAHAAMAHWLGDDTALYRGRMTLNPFAHMDPMGPLCMFLFSLGWGKPVPVNLVGCRKVKIRTADILVSVAGPASNVILAFVFVLVSKIIAASNGIIIQSDGSMMYYPGAETALYIVEAMWMIAAINAGLAVFNLVPVPPLDGYSLLSAILPRKAGIWIENHARIINIVMLVLIFTGMLSIPLGFLSDKIVWVLNKATGFIK